MKFDFTIEDGVLKKYNAPILGCDAVVTVPDGVTAIGNAAFYYIRGIDRVILPASVRSIGDEAFYMCEGMKAIEMPPALDRLGARAFAHCHTLESIVIPEGVSVIHENTFYKCERLGDVHLPRSLTEIEPGAFFGAYLIGKVYYAGTRTEYQKQVKGGVFGGGRYHSIFCGYDENEKWDSDPRDFTVEDGVLLRYSGKASTVFLPRGVHTVAEDAFDGMWRDEPMYRLVLPEGVTKIEEGALRFEEELRELVIPKSLTHLSADAFFACLEDKRVIYRGTVAEWAAIREEMHIPDLVSVECSDGKYL